MNPILLLTDTGDHDNKVLREKFFQAETHRHIYVGKNRVSPQWAVLSSNSGSIDSVTNYAINYLEKHHVFLLGIDLLYQDDQHNFMPRGLTDVYDQLLKAGLKDRWKVKPIIYSRAMHEDPFIVNEASEVMRSYGFDPDPKKEDLVDRVADDWMDRFVGICYRRMTDYVAVHQAMPTYP